MKNSKNEIQPECLVIRTRSDVQECSYYGDYCIVDENSNLIDSAGDPNHIVFMRSCAKPFQAIPVVNNDIQEKYHLTKAEIAFIASSHTGQPSHIEIAQQILDKTTLSIETLKCGLHYPFDENAKFEMISRQQLPSVLHNNCSGKHIGMLLVCRELGWSQIDYFKEEHPLQILILKIIQSLASSNSTIHVGIDGCGVPTYGMPLLDIAKLYNRLVDTDVNSFDRERAIICDAMFQNPFFVAGDGLLETEAMKRVNQKIIMKRGADGLLCMGIPERKIGIAIKVRSGERMPVNVIAMHLLQKFELIDDDGLYELQKAIPLEVTNWHGELTGKYTIRSQ